MLFDKYEQSNRMRFEDCNMYKDNYKQNSEQFDHKCTYKCTYND